LNNPFNNKQSTINNSLSIYCDGGSRGNPGEAAIGFVVKNSQDKIIYQEGEYIGKATNNVAEYTAVITALQWLINSQSNILISQYLNIIFYLDSLLVVNQLNGLYKIKNASLRNLIITIRQLENQLKSNIIYQQIPRCKNYLADKLVNITLDKQSVF
jgi:ribonuclease HI